MVDVMTKETDTLSNQAENNLEALFEALQIGIQRLRKSCWQILKK